MGILSLPEFHQDLFGEKQGEPTLITFHYTGWLIGILLMGYYNPYITG